VVADHWRKLFCSSSSHVEAVLCVAEVALLVLDAVLLAVDPADAVLLDKDAVADAVLLGTDAVLLVVGPADAVLLAVLRRGQTWTDVDSRGQTWTDVDSRGQTWTDVDRRGQTWTDVWTDVLFILLVVPAVRLVADGSSWRPLCQSFCWSRTPF
jgi:hypothetical protein